MRESFDETRQQIYEFRHFLGHLNLEIRDLEERISELRISLEERVERIEAALNLPPRSASRESLPAHEDKESPEILPQQKPGA